MESQNPQQSNVHRNQQEEQSEATETIASEEGREHLEDAAVVAAEEELEKFEDAVSVGVEAAEDVWLEVKAGEVVSEEVAQLAEADGVEIEEEVPSAEADEVEIEEVTHLAEADEVEIEDEAQSAEADEVEIEEEAQTAEVDEVEIEEDVQSTEANEVAIEEEAQSAEADEVEIEEEVQTAEANEAGIEEEVQAAEANEVTIEEVTQSEETVNAEEANHATTTVDSSNEATADAIDADNQWFAFYPEEVRQHLNYPEVNIAQFLIDAATQFPSKQAIYFMGKSITYEELYVAADRLARGLGRIGVHKGDRVAIMLPNSPQAVIAYYGVLLAGAVVVQTNPLYMERELKHLLNDSGAVTLIVLDLLFPRIERVRGKQPENGPLPKLKNVIVTSIKDGLPFPKNKLYPIKQRREGFRAKIPYGMHGYMAWTSVISKKSLSFERPTLGEHHELAALQYTGGTTGTPKGVMLTHRNLVSNTLQIAEWCTRVKIGQEKYLAVLPLFHVFGLTVLMNMSVRTAGSLILLPKFEVDEVLKTIELMKPTIFPGAPTMYIGIIQAARKQKKAIDLSSIEVCISGSATLPLEVQEQFEQLTGGRLIEGYGLTESSPVTHANPIWGKRKIGTIGLPLPDTEAAIISLETGERLPVGELGELIVKGPQVMSGYWNKPDATAEVLQDGWLRTGDLAMMDEDGYFIIMDRIKDIIIAGGFNIYPREIEEVLFEHPAIAEASVVGIKDHYRGETVKAYVVLRENHAVTEEQLDMWCRDRLAAFKVPHQYAFRDQLPKTMVGKVLRRKLIEEEQQHE